MTESRLSLRPLLLLDWNDKFLGKGRGVRRSFIFRRGL